eukprot:353613-Chlamydomonas_euryale.AAC.1
MNKKWVHLTFPSLTFPSQRPQQMPTPASLSWSLTQKITFAHTAVARMIQSQTAWCTRLASSKNGCLPGALDTTWACTTMQAAGPVLFQNSHTVFS